MRGPPRLKYGSSEDDELWAEAPWTTKENLRVRRHLAQSIKQPMRKNPGSQEPWAPIPILTPLQNYMNLTFCKISACVCVCVVASVMSNSLQPYELQPTRLLCPWDSPGKNTGMGYHTLHRGIFLTQGLNPCLLCLLHW